MKLEKLLKKDKHDRKKDCPLNIQKYSCRHYCIYKIKYKNCEIYKRWKK